MATKLAKIHSGTQPTATAPLGNAGTLPWVRYESTDFAQFIERPDFGPGWLVQIGGEGTGTFDLVEHAQNANVAFNLNATSPPLDSIIQSGWYLVTITMTFESVYGVGLVQPLWLALTIGEGSTVASAANDVGSSTSMIWYQDMEATDFFENLTTVLPFGQLFVTNQGPRPPMTYALTLTQLNSSGFVGTLPTSPPD